MLTLDEVIRTAQDQGYYSDLVGLARHTHDLTIVIKFMLTYALISERRRVDPTVPLHVHFTRPLYLLEAPPSSLSALDSLVLFKSYMQYRAERQRKPSSEENWYSMQEELGTEIRAYTLPRG